MASAQEPGVVTLYRSRPNGDKKRILRASVAQLAASGGAPDGAYTSLKTPDTWPAVDSDVVLMNDDVLLVSYTSVGSDGIDASDCIWSIPTVGTAGTSSLTTADFANPTFADITLAAGVETFVAGYKVVEGQLRVSGRILMDFQDDTA